LACIVGGLYPQTALSKSGPKGMLRVNTQVDLRSDPSDSSDSLGRIPAGTYVKSLSKQEEGFRRVSVELESGETLEGWIKEEAVTRRPNRLPAKEKRSSSDLPDVDDQDEPPKKVVVPQDEALLLRRNPSFLYGVEGGLNYGIIRVANDLTGNNYLGFGFLGGGYIGIFLTPTFPVRLEVMFSQINGTNGYSPPTVVATSNANYGFNFLDVAVIPTLIVQPFEFFAGLQYAFGLGLNYTPANVTIKSASDLSSLGVQGGFGYRFDIGYLTNLSIRLRYELAFQQTPFLMQAVGLLFALEFQG